jgi:hypothetical protein
MPYPFRLDFAARRRSSSTKCKTRILGIQSGRYVVRAAADDVIMHALDLSAIRSVLRLFTH